MRQALALVFAGLTLLWAQALQAVEVKDLDKAQVKVSSRSNASLNQGMKAGLTQVLMKNSGGLAQLDEPLLKSRLAAPRALISQYGYTDVDGQLWLEMSFDHKQILALLRQSNQPIWAAQRPLTLMWMVDEQSEEQTILSDTLDSEFRDQLLEQAQQVGMPMLLPLMDLDDAMTVAANDVKGQFIDPVATASARYRSDFFAMASVQSSLDGVFYQLQLYPKNSNTQGFVRPVLNLQDQALDADAALAAMMSAISGYYVDRYAVVSTGESDTVSLSFAPIKDLTKLVELERYLSSLPSVKSLLMSNYQGEVAQFDVALFGQLAELEQQLSLDSRISPVEASDTPSDDLQPKQELNFWWQP
ncbi:DUF2066 domain-containing protein [Paraferrimonas sedimenticola]|uniref:DUF2066 domain-containing protein n=1 Tax=Paraferrimonas sedimenticola TaxID=375674 RepID=A0AA37W027_9GAMM|nr:DUF2066 domain-containing protein [Paraferrimonas sedimenticola]GLP94783.1 hypothetical protein GCM10007895_00890 [Paraferrimonas sedimenticola]